MGQLEKYGLYVLCLVIFLILGVTIWGGGDLPPQAGRAGRPASSSELKANPRQDTLANASIAANPAEKGAATGLPDLASLLRPAEPPKKPEVKPVDASGPAKAPVPGTTLPSTEPVKPPTEAPRPTHKVERGDTFDSIAKDKLGSAALRTEIARLNAKVDPSRLQVGQQLLLPTAAEVAALTKKDAKITAPVPNDTKKRAAEAGTYTIAKGDTFESIARRELGSIKRVNELREANPNIDPKLLRIGQSIQLPKK